MFHSSSDSLSFCQVSSTPIAFKSWNLSWMRFRFASLSTDSFGSFCDLDFWAPLNIALISACGLLLNYSGLLSMCRPKNSLRRSYSLMAYSCSRIACLCFLTHVFCSLLLASLALLYIEVSSLSVWLTALISRLAFSETRDASREVRVLSFITSRFHCFLYSVRILWWSSRGHTGPCSSS